MNNPTFTRPNFENQHNPFIMKQFLRSITLMAALMMAFTAQAQLPNGSICPDFTGTDIDGNTWNLYDLLDEGKAVIIEISATWCGPCWGYHTSNELKDFYNAYGPDGTNEAMVLFIEGDGQTGMEDLMGNTGTTQGDWITGTPFPIIDDASISNLLSVGYFPTIYTVCPSRVITETGQGSMEDHYAFIQENACQPASLSNDPSLIAYNGATEVCGEAGVPVTLMNFGLQPLTAATIEVSSNGQVLATEEWTGNLNTYETEIVNVGTVSVDGSLDIDVDITSADDNMQNNSLSASLVQGEAEVATTHIYIEVLTDEWAGETGLELTNATTGEVVFSIAAGELGNVTPYQWDVFVPSAGCYAFRITDTYGDGMNGTQWGGSAGYCGVFAYQDGEWFNEIYSYDGSYDFVTESALADVQTVVSVEENEAVADLNVYPNPTNGILNLNFNTLDASEVTVELVNLLGAVVIREDLGTLQAGAQRLQYDLTNLEAGMYLMNVTVDGEMTTVRVNLTK